MTRTLLALALLAASFGTSAAETLKPWTPDRNSQAARDGAAFGKAAAEELREPLQAALEQMRAQIREQVRQEILEEMRAR